MIPCIFISSTIDDLRYLRDALRDAVLDLAYTPVMSEHAEVGYIHPNTAAESCYRSVQRCQMAVVIVGKRYGTPSEDGISVTHKEFRAAREHDIPLIAFVEAQVLSYKDVYEANPESDTWKKFDRMDHPKLTFSLLDEIKNCQSYNGLIPFNSVEEAKHALKLQIADFVGESLSQVFSSMRSDLKDVFAEIKTLRHELVGERQPNPDFLTALRFIIDDSKHTGFRQLIEYTVGPIDKAIPLLLSSKSLDEFFEETDCKLLVQESADTYMEGEHPEGMLGVSGFLVPSSKEESGHARATFAAFADQRLVMNDAAKRHFEWVFNELKRQVGTERKR